MDSVKLVFREGPWDGVEIDAPFPPDELRMKFSLIEGGRNEETGKLRFKFHNRDHHVYKSEENEWPNVERVVYNYQPD